MLAVLSSTAQKKEKTKYLFIAVTNSHTAQPFHSFARLFTSNYHPGVEIGAGIDWINKSKHDWFQTFSTAYSYHRWVQQSIVLYTELGYRYKFPKGFGLAAKIGGGYMRAIIVTDVFSDGMEDGKQYSSAKAGRNQAILTGSFVFNKTFQTPIKTNLFLEYQQRLQTPFIASYVPLLPYNIMMLGVSFPIHTRSSK